MLRLESRPANIEGRGEIAIRELVKNSLRMRPDRIVVGEVRDEFDQEREPRVDLGPGVLEVSGEYPLDDLAEEVFLGEADDLPDVETVGGLIVSLLKRPPLNGDEVSLHQVRFTVLDIDRLAVLRARVEFPTHKTTRGESETDKEEE